MAIQLIKKRPLLTAAGIFLGGTLLLGALAQSQYLLMPEPLESVGHTVYRVAFFIVLPLRLILRIFSSGSGFHPSPVHLALISYMTSLGLWATWKLFKYLRRKGDRPDPAPQAIPVKPLDSESPAPRPDRRWFLRQSALGAAAVVGLGGGAWGALIEPDRLQVRSYTIALRGLPEALAGLRIVHLSDTHYGPYISLPYLRHVIARVNELAPDLIVLTGDYVHQTPRSIPKGIGVFGELRARLGTLAVLGNHDHWEGARACRQAFAGTPVRLIDNERIFVTAGGLVDTPAPDSICIGGVGDLWEDAMLPARAVADAPEAMPRLVLSHNPDVSEEWPAGVRVDLIFAGHTHGGQVSLPGIGAPIVPSAYGQKYEGGLCDSPVCPVIISRGAGMAVLPFRLGVPPEIGWVTLAKLKDG